MELEDVNALIQLQSFEEIEQTVMSLNPWKAPGPDRMHAAFYQKFWPVIKNDVFHHILDFLAGTKNISPFNSALIYLLPKKNNRHRPEDFRPISLCNISYKILAKLIASRIKQVLPKVIPAIMEVLL